MKELTQEQINKLNTPLPKEALKPHPTKSFLTSINSIFVTERLNDVFGVGQWTIKTEFVASKDVQTKKGISQMIVCKTTLEVPDYGIHYESFGGNDNEDLGDAYKGAVTDAITKIGSWLGIGAHVWKNKPNAADSQPAPAAAKRPSQAPYSHAAPAAPKPASQPANVGYTSKQEVIRIISSIKTREEMNSDVWKKYPQYQNDAEVQAAMKKRLSVIDGNADGQEAGASKVAIDAECDF